MFGIPKDLMSQLQEENVLKMLVNMSSHVYPLSSLDLYN